MLRGTDYVLMDEPAYKLVEMNLPPPDSKAKRRYQIIYVIRDDWIAEYRRDMGLAKSYKAEQLRVMGGVIDESTGRIFIEHTVGELMDIANYIREKPAFDKRELAKIN